MTQPKIAAQQPTKVTLEAGKNYAWCSCGQSTKQPFCDGSHRGSEFRPKVFTQEETTEVWLCNCKHTGNSPFCDGTHKTL